MIYVNVEMIFGWIIVSFVALIMIIIGVSQIIKKDVPVGFYNLIAPPKKDEITNLAEWNKKHGMIWIAYGVCIEAGFLMGCFMPNESLEMIFMIGGVIIPLPLMILRHHMLEKEYKRD